MKNKLTILMGLPGSGKSTYAKNMRKDRTVILTPDYIREMFFGSYVYDEAFEPLVKKVILDAIVSAADNGFNVIVDECNVTPERRKEILDVGRSMGMVIDLHVLSTDVETCCKRRAVENRGYAPETWVYIINMHQDDMNFTDDELSNYDNVEFVSSDISSLKKMNKG